MTAAVSPVLVTIAVPTYRRPAHLAELLPALVRQGDAITAAGAFAVETLVIDNDPNGSARAVLRSFPRASVRYALEPIAGISAARNRAIDASPSSRLLAFIDDDERPHDGWLHHLLTVWQQADEPVAVSGRVIAEYESDLDPWIDAGQFFVRRRLPTGTLLDVAAAGNLLLDLRAIRALNLHFAEDLGLSGGEDTLFTREIAAAGGRMVWCDESAVVDRVPAERMTRRWVLARAWSHGNSTSLVALRLAGTNDQRVLARIRGVTGGAARVVGGSLRCVRGGINGSLRDRARGRRAVYRGAGMMYGAFGFVYHEYARESPSVKRRRRGGGPGAESNERPLMVLQSFPQPRVTTNPYIVMLAERLQREADLRVHTFTWRHALLGRYDVFHVHWPEILVSGSSAPKKLVRQSLFALLLLRSRILRTPLVRTVHNLELPRGISRRERLLLRITDRWTTLRITINPITSVPPGCEHVLIEHGHYRDWFSRYPACQPDPGRIGYVGLIRRYKGVDRLITAFQQASADDPELRLRIAGRPSTAALADELIGLADGDGRISLHLQFLSEREFVEEVTAAELVVLPYLEMHNSGGALAALSLDRPVLVPDNEVNRRLADEVGPGWVHRYRGTLAGRHLTATLAAVRVAGPRPRPNLTRRNWNETGRRHVGAYLRALAISRGSRASRA